MLVTGPEAVIPSPIGVWSGRPGLPMQSDTFVKGWVIYFMGILRPSPPSPSLHGVVSRFLSTCPAGCP